MYPYTGLKATITTAVFDSTMSDLDLPQRVHPPLNPPNSSPHQCELKARFDRMLQSPLTAQEMLPNSMAQTHAFLPVGDCVPAGGLRPGFRESCPDVRRGTALTDVDEARGWMGHDMMGGKYTKAKRTGRSRAKALPEGGQDSVLDFSKRPVQRLSRVPTYEKIEFPKRRRDRKDLATTSIMNSGDWFECAKMWAEKCPTWMECWHNDGFPIPRPEKRMAMMPPRAYAEYQQHKEEVTRRRHEQTTSALTRGLMKRQMSPSQLPSAFGDGDDDNEAENSPCDGALTVMFTHTQ
ncbi:hypothetical protein LTS18_003106, partial [Coniosporium uncinatum]